MVDILVEEEAIEVVEEETMMVLEDVVTMMVEEEVEEDTWMTVKDHTCREADREKEKEPGVIDQIIVTIDQEMLIDVMMIDALIGIVIMIATVENLHH